MSPQQQKPQYRDLVHLRLSSLAVTLHALLCPSPVLDPTVVSEALKSSWKPNAHAVGSISLSSCLQTKQTWDARFQTDVAESSVHCVPVVFIIWVPPGVSALMSRLRRFLLNNLILLPMLHVGGLTGSLRVES